MSDRVFVDDYDLDHVIHVLAVRAKAEKKKLAAETADARKTEIRRMLTFLTNNIYRITQLRDAIRTDKPSASSIEEAAMDPSANLVASTVAESIARTNPLSRDSARSSHRPTLRSAPAKRKRWITC